MSSLDASIEIPDDAIDPAPPTRSRRTVVLAIVMWLAIALVSVAALYGGTKLRFGFFDFIAPLHVQADNARNFGWGYYTYYSIHDRGRSFLDTFDDVGVQPRGQQNYIDFTPGQLAVSTLWVRMNHTWAPYAGLPKPAPPKTAAEIETWQRSQRDFWAWFIDFSVVIEAIGCVGAFLLTRHVLLSAGKTALRANIVGLIAALLLWFNFGMIINGYGWPGTDLWVVPPFLWAVYLCRRGNWALGGAVLAIGALFKGQLFFVLPMFLLWPLVQLVWQSKLKVIRRVFGMAGVSISEESFTRPDGTIAPLKLQTWRAPAAFLGGFIGVFGLATCGWTLTQVDAQHIRSKSWMAIAFTVALPLVTIALVIARLAVLPRIPREKRWVSPTILGVLIALPIVVALWPCFAWKLPEGASPVYAYVLLALMAVTSVLAVQFARRWQTIATLGIGLFGAAALASMLFFATSFAWLDAGYLFGLEHERKMVGGQTSNLPGIMNRRFDFRNEAGPAEPISFGPAWYTLNAPVQTTLKTLLIWIYALTLLLTSIGIAFHDRRRSPRFLIAVVAPWVLLFTIPCQIEERYLLFAAAAASVCVGHSVGGALLSIFMTAVTWVMTVHAMMREGQGLGAPIRRAWGPYLETMYPTWFVQKTRAVRELYSFCEGTFPDIGWAIILTALIFLWLSLTPAWIRRRPTPQALPAFAVIEPAPLQDELVETQPVIEVDNPPVEENRA